MHAYTCTCTYVLPAAIVYHNVYLTKFDIIRTCLHVYTCIRDFLTVSSERKKVCEPDEEFPIGQRREGDLLTGFRVLHGSIALRGGVHHKISLDEREEGRGGREGEREKDRERKRHTHTHTHTHTQSNQYENVHVNVGYEERNIIM